MTAPVDRPAPSDHEVDMLRVPICLTCGKDVWLDDDTESWGHDPD